MSTNFYVKESREHIGKRWGIGNGWYGFSWAIRPGRLLQLPRKGKAIVDEYGRGLSVSEFVRDTVDHIHPSTEQTDLIGKESSWWALPRKVVPQDVYEYEL